MLLLFEFKILMQFLECSLPNCVNHCRCQAVDREDLALTIPEHNQDEHRREGGGEVEEEQEEERKEVSLFASKLVSRSFVRPSLEFR